MRVRLGDVAKESRETIKGSKLAMPAVGLEHLTPGELTLTAWDVHGENTFTKLFHKGQILFGRRRAYLRKAAVAPFDGICSGDITVIEALPGKILPELLPFIIQNDTFFDYAVGKSAGSLSPRAKWEHLRDFEFRLPSHTEQHELAGLLWAANSAREAYKNLLATTDELVKSRFVEMFGELATNDMGWSIKPFDEFAKIDALMTTDYDKYADYPHIGIDSIESVSGELKGYRTVKQDGVKSGKYIFTPDHIIYSKIRPNLNKVALPTFDGLCSADAYPIRNNDENCDKFFLAYVLRSELFLAYILPLSYRTNFPKANREQIAGFSMPLPPLELQHRFADFVRAADKSKLALQQTIDELDATYKAILRDAFSNI